MSFSLDLSSNLLHTSAVSDTGALAEPSGAVDAADTVDARDAPLADGVGPGWVDSMREHRVRRAIEHADAGRPGVQIAPTAGSAGEFDPYATVARIDASLRQWVDLTKVAPYADRPGDLLQGVARHFHTALPPGFDGRPGSGELEDEAIFDAAAVLYRRLHDDASMAAPPVLPPIADLRVAFAKALQEDRAAQQAMALLLPVPNASARRAPFFDGFALRNASRMSFQSLLASPDLCPDPVFTLLLPQQKRGLLERKFEQIGESVFYRFGTPEHSMATAVERIQRYRGQPVPPELDDPSVLLQTFRRIEEEWHDAPFYPTHPRLLFAAHLARSNDIVVSDPANFMLLYRNDVEARAGDELARGNHAPMDWITAHLSKFDKDGKAWDAQGKAAATAAIESLIGALHEAAAGEGPIGEFARKVSANGALGAQRVVVGDWVARTQALIEYSNERLLAGFGTPPRFEREQAARDILRGLKLTDEEIEEERHYTIGGDNPNISKTAFGTRIDEFLDRADWTGLVGSRMWPRPDIEIVPRDSLQAAEEKFNAALPSNPWVVARAKEKLWERSEPITAAAVEREASQIASAFAAETEQHRATVRGFETWINTVPVLGSLYNIEEGVRHKDAAQAAFGLIFLGVDLFDLSTGGGSHAGTGRPSHPVATRLGRVAARTDGAMIELSAHPSLARAAADRVDIGLRDSEIPSGYSELVQRVRSGGRHVRWREFDIVHLADEDRIVPILSKDGLVYEIDWRTARRTRDQRMVERDPVTERYYMDPDAGLDVRPDTPFLDLQERITVKKVERALARANDLALRDFKRIVSENFEIELPPGPAPDFDIDEFYETLFQTSPTFRRLANRFDDEQTRARNEAGAGWKKWAMVVGDANPLGSPTKAYTDFDAKRIFMPKDCDIHAMQYESPNGRESWTLEQAYLREMIHAFTGEADPVPAMGLLNRGSPVYLTDKILNEAGYRFPEQVMSPVSDPSPDPEQLETFDAHRDAALRAAQAEDAYLDPIVDSGRGPVSGDARIGETPLTARATVREAKAIVDTMPADEDDVFLSWHDFETQFEKRFVFVASPRGANEVLQADAQVLSDFYRRLYRESETFRHLLARSPRTDAQGQPLDWKIVLDSDAPADAVLQGAARNESGTGERRLYLDDDEMQYLSDAGLRGVEFERQLTYEVVRALGGFELLGADDAYLNRGAAVYFTDRVLDEAGFHYPRQISAALALSDDADALARLQSYRTAAQRAAALEDRYLGRD